MSFPDLNALIHRHSLNYHGRIRVKPIAEGILGQTPNQIQQVNLIYFNFPLLKILLLFTSSDIFTYQIFHKIDCTLPSEADSKRFDYFISKVRPISIHYRYFLTSNIIRSSLHVLTFSASSPFPFLITLYRFYPIWNIQPLTQENILSSLFRITLIT